MISTYQSNLENFYYWAQKQPNEIFLKQPLGDDYIDFTYQEAENHVNKLAAFLQEKIQLGPKHVGIMSKNSAYWILADLAISSAGCVSVPFYATLTAEQLNEVLVHSDCQILIVGKLDHWESIKSGIPSNVLIIHSPESEGKEAIQWNDILGQEFHTFQPHKPQVDELSTIVYTSGTTGTPKGVMIPNSSVAQALNLARKIAYLDTPQTRFISYLPLCHIAERNIVEFACIAAGGTIYFVENLNTFKENLHRANPTHFLAVPRIWSKFQEGILEKIGGQKKLNLLLSIPILKQIIKNKIKKGLGLDKAILMLTGAAPMPPELLKWYQKIDFFIQEAYGMTENMGLNSLMPRDEIRIGSVGKIYETCQTRIDPDTKEIQMKAGYNSWGYYKEKQLTQELFVDGWLKTGDMGEIDSDGFLSIIGRVKDNFKTAKGQYVSPAPIENKLSVDPHIEQCCVVGINLPQPIALIVLSLEGKKIETSTLIGHLEALVKNTNPQFKKYEHLSKMIVLKEDWTIENNCITPTLKIKRPIIEKKYLASFETWNNQTATIIFE
jgi:long-subunit acyl-CoA synthetase (AMP-forming)